MAIINDHSLKQLKLILSCYVEETSCCKQYLTSKLVNTIVVNWLHVLL